MKRIITFVTALIMSLTAMPASFAAEENSEPYKLNREVKHGDYLDERYIELFDENSRGIIAFPEYETMYDFDSGKLPEGLKAENSEVEISNKYHGTTASHSLKWTTHGPGSKLTLTADTVGMIDCWNSSEVIGVKLNSRTAWFLTLGILQEAMPKDGVTRKFHINLIVDGTALGGYDIYLHRAGWTFGTNQVWPPKGSTVNSIVITQMAGSGGEVFVDDVALYMRNTRDLRSTPYSQSETLYSENIPSSKSDKLTKEEEEAFEIIAQRAMPDPEPVERLTDEQMEEFREYYKFWEITPVEGTDFVNGYCPLYFHRAAPGDIVDNRDSYVMNGDAYKLCSKYEALGINYHAVQDKEQKAELEKYVVDIAKLAITYSNVPDSWYTGAGFAEGAYYARDALEKAGIASAMSRQLKEQYTVDKILYVEHKFDNEEVISRTDTKRFDFNWAIDADNLFNATNATMISLLVDANTPEKARDMYLFKDYMDKLLLNYTPNKYGTLKPDGSLFHHELNKYDYGWSQAWDGITKYVYWFHNTPFAPSEETLERISHFAEVRYKDLGMDNKGGLPGHQGSNISTKGILRLALSGMYDGSLDINPYRASEWLAYGNGGAEAEKFLAMGIKPATAPQSNLTESYAVKNIHRRLTWRVHTYGQNHIIRSNEYIRPATLFFNMGGILLDIPGQHAPMLIKSHDNIYGRDTFVPAPGYNFSRAPGVTAPDTKDKTQLKSLGTYDGSSAYVGGVSTKNGNGVFMNPFDSADNTTDYANTVASDFRFKKSYFYFDDKIVCLASNIGYGGKEKVSTGLFQEKMTDEDNISFSGGITLKNEKFNETYSSDDRPWLSDNIGNAMYYLFPGQSYTVTRGEQEFLFKEKSEDFDGKGNFVSAYINHPIGETSIDKGSYAYIIAPSSGVEKMEKLEESMKSETPEFEILRRDKLAHIVRSNKLNSIGYAIFDKSATFDTGAVKKVSAPSAIMTKTYENGRGMSLAIADPNLRIDCTEENPLGWSLARKLTVTLNGRWHVKEIAHYTARDAQMPEIQFTADGNTLLTVNCKDGLTNEYLLENIDNPFSDTTAHTVRFTDDGNEAELDGQRISLLQPITKRDGIRMIAVADIAKLLDADITWNREEKRTVITYNDKRISFTANSKIATIDNSLIILDHETVIDNGRNFASLSILKDILKTNVMEEDNTVLYVWNDAEWKAWDEAPSAPEAPHPDSITIEGYQFDYNKDTKEYSVEVPEGVREVPEVRYTVSEDYTVTMEKAVDVPGKTVINLSDKNNRLNTSIYTIRFVYPKTAYKITASSVPQPENKPDNTMDSDFNTYWTCNMNGEFITYEAEETVLFSGVGLAFMAGDKRKAFFDVEVSEDGKNWTMAYPNGETSGKTLDLERYDFTPIRGKFLRVKGYGNSNSEWFSLAEAEVYKKNITK